jgi:hypothetical protein
MDQKAVVRADAVFEAALGLALLASAASDGLDFPHPVGRVAVAIAGAGLLLFAAFLWRARIGLTPLAAGNLATAVAAVGWLAACTGFSTAGAALVGAAIAGLVALAVAELALGRERRAAA